MMYVGFVALAVVLFAVSLGLVVAYWETRTPTDETLAMDPGRMDAEEYERLNQMRAGTYRKRGCSIGPGR